MATPMGSRSPRWGSPRATDDEVQLKEYVVVGYPVDGRQVNVAGGCACTGVGCATEVGCSRLSVGARVAPVKRWATFDERSESALEV